MIKPTKNKEKTQKTLCYDNLIMKIMSRLV